MSKKQTIVAKKKTAELLSQLSQAKAAKLKRVRDYQLPTKAHTSNKAKVAIAFSLIQGAVALTLIAAAGVHKLTCKNGSCCRPKVTSNLDDNVATKSK